MLNFENTSDMVAFPIQIYQIYCINVLKKFFFSFPNKAVFSSKDRQICLIIKHYTALPWGFLFLIKNNLAQALMKNKVTGTPETVPTPQACYNHTSSN